MSLDETRLLGIKQPDSKPNDLFSVLNLRLQKFVELQKLFPVNPAILRVAVNANCLQNARPQGRRSIVHHSHVSVENFNGDSEVAHFFVRQRSHFGQLLLPHVQVLVDVSVEGKRAADAVLGFDRLLELWLHRVRLGFNVCLMGHHHHGCEFTEQHVQTYVRQIVCRPPLLLLLKHLMYFLIFGWCQRMGVKNLRASLRWVHLNVQKRTLFIQLVDLTFESLLILLVSERVRLQRPQLLSLVIVWFVFVEPLAAFGDDWSNILYWLSSLLERPHRVYNRFLALSLDRVL